MTGLPASSHPFRPTASTRSSVSILPPRNWRSPRWRLAWRPRSPAAARGRLKAFRGTPGRLRQAYGPGWMLVGDAGFFRDPLTSHGISDALRDAEGAAMAILSDRESALREFQEVRDSLALPILETTDAISDFDWSLDELPARHKRFSEAMKSEVAVLSARAELHRAAQPSAPEARTPAGRGNLTRKTGASSCKRSHDPDGPEPAWANPRSEPRPSGGGSRGPATSSPSAT